MAIINHMMKKIDTDVANLKQGLHPQNLSYWYGKIIKETIEMAPPWLQDKSVSYTHLTLPTILLV